MSDRSESIRQTMAKILPEVLKERGWEAQLELHSIFLHWRKVADEDMASHAEPLKIVKGTLWIEVENSAWLQQLQYRKVALLREINAFLPREKIRAIRLVLPRLDQPPRPSPKAVRFVPPPPESLRSFEAQAACIEDKEIREGLVRLWYLSKACVVEEGK